MVSREKFEEIKENYGYWSSWALWAEVGETPKSNVGDLSIFEGDAFLNQLNPKFVLVGLNISRADIERPLANFHSPLSKAKDYKIRYAVKGTPLWGAYMTDVIKDYDEVDSGKVKAYLRNNKQFELDNIIVLIKEIEDLGVKNPILVALGDAAYDILSRNISNYKIVKIKHYSHYLSKEKYREEVSFILENLKMEQHGKAGIVHIAAYLLAVILGGKYGWLFGSEYGVIVGVISAIVSAVVCTTIVGAIAIKLFGYKV